MFHITVLCPHSEFFMTFGNGCLHRPSNVRLNYTESVEHCSEVSGSQLFTAHLMMSAFIYVEIYMQLLDEHLKFASPYRNTS